MIQQNKTITINTIQQILIIKIYNVTEGNKNKNLNRTHKKINNINNENIKRTIKTETINI